ncbi:MAG: hypothetical protein Q4E55_02955 [Bacteroidales bacterium]|nr:hypothetical protein [Bacteroidales bacterium]
MRKSLFILLFLLATSSWAPAAKRTIYISYILHGNMNYDRYVRPTIWQEFPKIYDGLLDFMDEHPDFKGQLQFSGQTLGSLLLTAPEVARHALRIHQRGQLNFTGTFYSEPVNVNMDGETNYRCAWLGTKIVEQFIGEKTDGFYLQERAYHPQLPWILSHSDVSWTPIITNDDSWFPFRLKGMDGTSSICVPITRSNIIERASRAPRNSLITIEEDYEIPQSFTNTYDNVTRYNAQNDSVRIEWITVKEYIRKFGVKPEKYIDHSAKAANRDNGTYSRWTSDPLDIITQEYTNKAMGDFRSAQIFSALLQHKFGATVDVPFQTWEGSLFEDPLTWNIEQASLYPDIEPDFLQRNGSVTLLSKAEHLLLWGVNSDAKGWYPLYEKRRERQNSFRNCSHLSQTVIHAAMDWLAQQIPMKGYDRYFLIAHMESASEKTLHIESPQPIQLFDLSTGQPLLQQQCVPLAESTSYAVTFRTSLPSFGYKALGAKPLTSTCVPRWTEGNSIESEGIRLGFADNTLTIHTNGTQYHLSLDSFQVKALTEMTQGMGDETWRQAVAYGKPRTAVCTNQLAPQLKIDLQPDWLVHLRLLCTIDHGCVSLDLDYDFPHPTLVRHDGAATGNTFNPEGLNLIIRSGKPCKVGYDIPFGISEYDKPGTSYFCALSTCFMQHAHNGIMVSPQTGEQAFAVNTDEGWMKVYMGASTTSGPIRNVGLTFKNPTDVDHEPAWYSEPFHGRYHHHIVVHTYEGSWQDAHLPRIMKANATPVYIREYVGNDSNGNTPAEQSLIQVDEPNIDITSAHTDGTTLTFRVNEREGKASAFDIRIGTRHYRDTLPPFGIREY